MARDKMSGKATDVALEAAKPAYPAGTAQKPSGNSWPTANATQPANDPWGPEWHNGSYHTERATVNPQAAPNQEQQAASYQKPRPHDVPPQTRKDHPDSYKRQSNAKELS